MNVTVSLEAAWQAADAATFFRNVWPLYLHDLSQYGMGFFRLDNLGRWLPDIVADWVAPVTAARLLREPRTMNDDRQPFQRTYVINCDGRRVGFVCVGLAPFRHMPSDADCIVAEMFVLPVVRGKGVAQQAARQAIRLHPGRWFLEAIPGNDRAIAFWRKTLPRLGGGDLVESETETGVSWRFSRGEHGQIDQRDVGERAA